MPAESTYGLSSVFYYIFAAVFFLVPVSLVAAELTTGWPQKGGVYRWVGEAFGKKWGFLAIWLQWIESTIWFPTVLTFAAVSLAFMGPGQRWDEALAANKWYVLIVVLCVYWAATLLNLRGMKTSAGVTKWGTIIGTIIPGAILILLGLGYWGRRQPDPAGYELGQAGAGHEQFQQPRSGSQHLPVLRRDGNVRRACEGCE